ncbi:hypothetical protein E4U42_004603 [Claviceps africana]|uniref:Uncharacterized protein n=1 Tax=Claviceps africana TaxID=83212 RepID=A0A8K0J559_9HYPO|nr:hypothetical protein E4U42_004603 [Claviceps africana]
MAYMLDTRAERESRMVLEGANFGPTGSLRNAGTNTSGHMSRQAHGGTTQGTMTIGLRPEALSPVSPGQTRVIPRNQHCLGPILLVTARRHRGNPGFQLFLRLLARGSEVGHVVRE